MTRIPEKRRRLTTRWWRQVKVAAVRKKNAEKEKGFAKKMFG